MVKKRRTEQWKRIVNKSYGGGGKIANRNLLTTLLSLALVTASCTDETESLTQTGTVLQLNVKTAGIETRGLIESATLPDASTIGLTLTDAGGSTYDNISYSNIQATASTGATPQTWTLASDILLSSTNGTLYGYYPYNSEVTDITQIPVTAGDTDYMYATPVENLNDGNYSPTVTMNHALAAIRLNIVRGTYTGTGAVTSVSISSDNIATSGKLNAKTGALSEQTGTGTAVTDNTAFTLSTTAKQIDQIIVPITSSSAAPTFTMTIDGNEYTATATAVTLVQGTIYQYTLTADAKSISLSDVKVGDWGYNDSGNPVIEAGYKITLVGDIEGIAFSNTINDDGSVTITAVPMTDNHVVSSVSTIGTATVTQVLDSSTGYRTITLSTVKSNVTINFESTYLPINATGKANGVYAVTATGELIDYNDAAVDATCLGVALVTDNQRIMIEKNGESNSEWNGNTSLYWGYNLSGKNVAGITDITSELDAMSDFNGKANTAAIIAAYTLHSVEMNTRDMCSVLQNFNTGTNKAGYTDWYIPSAGQLFEIYYNITNINTALSAMSGTSISDDCYWSSSEKSSYSGFVMVFEAGYVDYYDKDYSRRVRLVRDINPKIKFYINGTQYNAEDGMTWEEWYNSSYNTTSLSIVGSNSDMIGVSNRVTIQLDDINFENVKISQPIIPNWIYYLEEGGGVV